MMDYDLKNGRAIVQVFDLTGRLLKSVELQGKGVYELDLADLGEWGVFLSGRDGGAGGFKGEIGGVVKKIVKLLYCCIAVLLYCFFWRYGLGYSF